MKKNLSVISGRVIFLGLGSENHSLLAWLHRHGFREPITVYDPSRASALGTRYESLLRFKNIEWQLGSRSMPALSRFDAIVRSPGILITPSERRNLADRITCPMQLFLALCPSRHTIGVTGTKGKGTTSSLIAAILKQAGKRVWLGGNIGLAPFSFMDKIKPSDWIVLELSSFQLQDMASSPHIAVFTNFSPEHLASSDPNNPNFHPNLSAYWQAKTAIMRFQQRGDIAIANVSLKPALKKANLRSRLEYFSASRLETSLPGAHNKENIAAAHAAAQVAGVSSRHITAAVKRFKGLEYRVQKIAVRSGISYYNDSFATTPIATMTALSSFADPIILLAGGADKGSSFDQMARLIAKKAKAVILFKGTALAKLKRSLKKAKYRGTIHEAASMKAALACARREAKKGDIILLSPGCASFGVFKNYKDRGKQFTQSIR